MGWIIVRVGPMWYWGLLKMVNPEWGSDEYWHKLEVNKKCKDRAKKKKEAAEMKKALGKFSKKLVQRLKVAEDKVVKLKDQLEDEEEEVASLKGINKNLVKKHEWSRANLLFNMKEVHARANAVEAELKHQRARYAKLETEASNVKSHIGTKKWKWMSKRKKYKRH